MVDKFRTLESTAREDLEPGGTGSTRFGSRPRSALAGLLSVAAAAVPISVLQQSRSESRLIGSLIVRRGIPLARISILILVSSRDEFRGFPRVEPGLRVFIIRD